jgi:competence protein ComEC
LPFLQAHGALRINYLVGSHAHNDHIGGFPYLMNHLKVDTLVLNRYEYNSKLFSQIFSIAADRNIPIRFISRGDQLYPDDECRVYVLHPDSSHAQAETRNGAECNNSSIVLKIQYGENGILFTGDLEMQGEYPVLGYDRFLESEIIKIGHHGSSTSTSFNLLARTNPLVAVISVAAKNKFKHPSPKTILRLRENGIRTYLTSKEGALIFDIGPNEITKIAWR